MAALVFGSGAEPGPRLLGELATCLRAGDGGADPLSVDEAAALVRTLARTHGLVLVIGVPGLLVPVGRAGWTLLDLAVAVSAPVVVVTGTGPDAANHTTLALGAVAGHGLAATVITDDGPIPADDGPMLDEGVPDAEPVRDKDEAETGTEAGAGTGIETPPLPPPATVRGKRVVLLLAGAFVALSLVLCGLAYVLPGQTVHTEVTLTQVTGHRPPAGPMPVPVPRTPDALTPRP